MERIRIQNTTLIGSYEEVTGVPVATIAKNDTSGATLDGLIIRGYETKFGRGKEPNTNGETFESGCFDDFVEEYFVKNKLNLPVDILHRSDLEHLAGRVLIMEVNTVGFYFVVYIPKSYKHYDTVRHLLKEGILQGFSKSGWAYDYDCIYGTDGNFSHVHVKKMSIYSLSLVDVPANAQPFEKVQETEIKNALNFVRRTEEEGGNDDKFNSMFN